MSAEHPDGEPERAWWKEAVVYQIYPRSFNDSDGDGVGDIPGITAKADYLDDLGVDAVWLCPVYDSPNHDNGYDIRDYRSIGSEFGTLADWEDLQSALADRGIRLVMDLVVNHTSSEHEWFRRSRSNPEGEYGDYYHWREGDPEEPPNNWESIFGGSAWTYDGERGAWYLHLFHETQPDLNWRNPCVRGEVKELMRWWLEKGVDGFRMDAINLLSKPAVYPDGDPDADLVGAAQFFDGPRLEAYLRELVDDVLEEYDAMTVAEMARTDIDTAAGYLESGAGLGMIFQSQHMEVDAGPEGIWDPNDWGDLDLTEFKRAVSRWQTGLRGRGWNSVFLGNHDQPRIVSRFGDEGYRRESATLLATFLLTLSGTPYLYQGDEIGMTNVEFESLAEVDDVETIGAVEDLIDRGVVDSVDEAMPLVNYWSRDHARTPMQWSDGPHAGFTDGEPWFPVNDNYATVNVEADRARPDSIWGHYRRLIELRSESDVLVYGDYGLLLPDHPRIYAYTRTLGDERALVVLNWSEDPSVFDPRTLDGDGAELIVSNYDGTPADPTGAEFRPYEAAVYRM